MAPAVVNATTARCSSTQVGATWKERDGRIVVEPFAPLGRATRRALEEETARLSAFVAYATANVDVTSMSLVSVARITQ